MRLTTLKPRLAPPTKPRTSTWGSGRGGRPWRRLRDQILARDLYTCQVCGKVADADQLDVDHIVNIAQGGSDDKSNLQTLCKPCHKIKTQKESQSVGAGKKFTSFV